MLTLTDEAATAIKRLAEQSEDPNAAGLRISTGITLQETVALEFAASPEPGDQIFEVHGSRIFLSPGADKVIEGLTLDFEVCAGRPTFSIVVRARLPERFGSPLGAPADPAVLGDLGQGPQADGGPPPKEPGR